MKIQSLLLWAALLAAHSLHAEEAAKPADENTTTEAAQTETALVDPDKRVISSIDLLDMLVEAGVLTRERADELLQQAVAKKSAAEIETLKNNGGESSVESNIVRVPYIPDFIKRQIRDDVRIGLREEVVGDVISQAEHERWGIPDALPSWVMRIKFSGDFRVRYQGDFFADANDDDPNQILPGNQFQNLLLDVGEVNDAGSINLEDQNQLINITEGRQRLRSRLRLAMDAKVTQGIKVGVRLATGNSSDPVSTNQTMGNSFGAYNVVFDRAYARYNSDFNEFYLWGGRMPNPWLSTDLVWDSDLNFDGVALKYYPLRSEDLDDDERIFETYLTAGVFPLSEVEYSQKDKWLLGMQWGVNWTFLDQDKFDIAVAYYDYVNIEGERNALGSNLNDFTAIESPQTGNTVFNIANPADPNSPDTLFGLAADYNLVDIVMSYNFANFAPIQVILTADYVKNIGYDKQKVLERSNGILLSVHGNDNGDAEVTGYLLKLDVGWPKVALRNSWDLTVAYKYLERDAVLDAFTDSDFHLGGTDAKGWVLGGRYAIDDNAVLGSRIIGTDQISSQPYGVDTVQIDMSVMF